VRADWLLLKAVSRGIDPTTGLLEIADRLDEVYQIVGADEVVVDGRVHPRTPGVMVLLWPILLVPLNAVFAVSVMVNAFAALFLVVVLVPAVTRRELSIHSASVVALSVMGFPMMSAIGFGTHSVVLSVLVWLGILLLRRRDTPIGGLLFGIAAVARVFPIGLILTSALLGRKRTVISGLAAGLCLTALGMVAFSIDLAETIGNLNLASEQWGAAPFNGSVGVWLRAMGWSASAVAIVLTGVAVVLTAVWTRIARTDVILAAGGTLLIWILLSPLSWPHYDVLVIPLACYVAMTGALKVTRTLSYLYLVAWALASTWAVGGGFDVAPATVIGIRALLMAAVVGEAWRRRADQAPSGQHDKPVLTS
jgi:hypothetical protein